MATNSIAWLISFIFFMLLGVPISISIGLGSLIAFLVGGKLILGVLSNMMYSSVDSFVLTAVPLFMMTGVIMNKGNIAKRIFNFAESLVGWSTGGLGAVNVVASMIFGGISGSAIADTAGLGPLEVYEMENRGYPRSYAAALTVASSTIAPIIPPSIMMVIFAVTAGVSALKMLVAGFVPGILFGVLLLFTNYFISRKNKYGYSTKVSLKNIWEETRKSFWAILSPVIILGGIISGYFTPTEAAAIAVIYSLFISMFIYKELNFKDLPEIFFTTAMLSGVSLLILSTASVAAHIFTIERIPLLLVDFINNLNVSLNITFFLISLFIIFTGMFVEGIAAVIILAPVLLPAMESFGISIIHFGVILVAGMCIGLITPPVGVCLFMMCNIIDISFESLVKRTLIFILTLYFAFLIIIYVPQLSEWLPNVLWP